jgi:hypothetical protein
MSDDAAIFVAFDKEERVYSAFVQDVLHRGHPGLYVDGEPIVPKFVRDWWCVPDRLPEIVDELPRK